MKKSKWIDWEIEYCLKKITRKDRTSQINGIVGVIMNINGNCDWIKNYSTNIHGQSVFTFKNEYLYPIIHKNIYNSIPPKVHCNQCNTFKYLDGSYFELVDENSFLASPQIFINNAFTKSDCIEEYDIRLG